MRKRVTNHSALGSCSTIFTFLFCLAASWIPLVPVLSDSSTVLAAPPITPSGLNTQVNLSQTPPSGKTQYDITGGTRPGGGPNLLQSFGDFNVPTNSIANFLNETGLATSNILGRVTGGSPSNIFGTIQTTNFGNTNLFLMNPAGILFGPNATLNVGGSVNFTTANYIRLFDGANSANFYANPTSDALSNSVLSVSSIVDFGFLKPAAYGFLGPDAASIVVRGSTLQVVEGQTLSLIGGTRPFEMATETATGDFVPSGVTSPSGIVVTGSTLSAPSGRIYIASVNSAGEVIPALPNQPAGLTVNSFSRLGYVELSGGTVVDVSTPIDADGNPLSINGSGTVSIRAGEFVMNGATISAQNLGTEPAAAIAIDIDVSGSTALTESLIAATTLLGGAGGDISVKAHTLNLTESSIQSFSTGGGKGGNIGITTGDTLSVGTNSAILSTSDLGSSGGAVSITAGSLLVIGGRIESQTADTGTGGPITIQATQNITVSNGGTIATSGGTTGAAGDITIAAGDTITLTGQSNGLTNVISSNDGLQQGSNAGNITLTAQKVVLENNALVDNNGVTSQAGIIRVTADQSIALSGGSRIRMDIRNQSGGLIEMTAPTITIDNASVRTRTGGVGDAGDIIVTGTNITLTNSQVTAASQGSGHGGNITVSASETLSMSGKFIDENGVTFTGGLSSQALGAGQSGKTTVTSGTVEIGAGARIDASTDRSGNAGPVEISATSLLLTGGGQIRSSSVMSTPGLLPIGAAGTITLHGYAGPGSKTDSLLIDGPGSGIFTETQGTGTGGNINVNAISVTLQNSGTLSAKTSGSTISSTGGTITVNSNQIQLSNGGMVTAESTGLGNAGAITINAGSDFQSNGGIVRTTAAHGAGGDILITAGQDIRLTNNAAVSASSTGPGNAGSITALAGDDFVMQNSSITTQATQASGGNIKIGAVDQIVLQNSLVSASVMGGGGSGGNISIDPTVVILQNSQILAQAVFGDGGNITITTPLFLADQTSLVSASSQFGLNGAVTIQNPTSNLSGKVSSLPSSMRQTQGLQTGRCAALANSQSSSLTIAGRDTMPAEPGGWLPSPFALAEEDGGPFAQPAGQLPPLFASAQETVSLRRLTPAGFLTHHFAESESTGCRS